MAQLSLLFRLQHIDSEIRQKKKRLGEVLAAQKESETLLAARGRHEAAAQVVVALGRQQREADRELAAVSDTLQTAEERLYSGKVKLTAELTDLQKKIKMLKRQREGLEEKGLEILVAAEEAEAEKDTAAAELTELEDNWQKRTASLREEQHHLATAINEWMAKRQEILPIVDKASLLEYSEVAKRRGGIAVVEVRREVCQGCQVKISAGIVEKARRGELVYCPNCKRIINPQ